MADMPVTEDKAKTIFRTYRAKWVELYGDSDMPEDLTVMEGPVFDGGAIVGMVYIYEGVLNASEAVVKFAIAHEMSHVVQVRVGQQFGLALPDHEQEATRAFRSEYMADLIAFHTLSCHFHGDALLVSAEFAGLKAVLGAGDTMHPSGDERVGRLQEYQLGAKNRTTSERAGVLGTILKAVMT
jgi:hypothetical protein